MQLRSLIFRVVLVPVLVIAAAVAVSAQGKDDYFLMSAPDSAPQVTLPSLLRAGHLEDLRWPDFSDYRSPVEEFYSRLHHRPAWVRDGQPSPQALQMIAILRQADSEGLHPEDYDSSRWPARLALLHRPALARRRVAL